jgi:RimJ/RimL family protein N-acetyltransferase
MSKTMLQDLQLNYNHFYKTINKDNISSIRVAEKCGFHADSECVKTRWLHTILRVNNGTQQLYSYSVK